MTLVPSGTTLLYHHSDNMSEPKASPGDPIEGPSVFDDNVQLNEDATQVDLDEAAQEELSEKLRREREARAQALTLEIVGDLPYAEVKPPENVLFVCKLNPVTEDDDLNLIFSRFGKILSCEVIRDKRTGDSLQYAFIEFEDQKACEQAYFKMQGVLIDDHRIHVDFSQSVSRLSDTWRTATNTKRANQSGGFGGVANLEKKRQYRAVDPERHTRSRKPTGYDMVHDKNDLQGGRNREWDTGPNSRFHSRSRSPRRGHHREDRPPPRRDERRSRRRSRDSRSRDHGRDRKQF
ncbi:Peptidyl-prolyl cis-trans isomerase-like 4 [Xanthoria parietina]